jgi:S1-C subfamily serine protease
MQVNIYLKEYQQMLYPTVRITTNSDCGSGVIINHKGTKDTENTIYILTAGHVVGDESEVKVEFFYPGPVTIDATVVATDTEKDLALLSIGHRAKSIEEKANSVEQERDALQFFKPNTARLAPQNYQYSLFASVYAVGCSLGLPPRPSSGILSALCDSAVEITAPVLPGNSGGPVYDARTYQVIGIAVWVKTYGDQLITTMAGIVPIQTIYEFINNHKDTKDTKNN